jgi:hypothetical protein
MTAADPFSKEELDELLGALSARRTALAKLYARAGIPNPDWRARDKKLREIQDKLVGMLKS